MCQVAWKYGQTPRDWQAGVIFPIFKKGDRKQYIYYREISLLSFPEKVYAKCLKKMPKNSGIKTGDGQCGFCPGRRTMDKIFTLEQIFEKSWEYDKDLFACFVDLEKAYDRVPRGEVWKVLRKYGVADGQLLRAITSFYWQPEVCVRVNVNGKQSKLFHERVGLRQGCALSPLLLIFYVNWIE